MMRGAMGGAVTTSTSAVAAPLGMGWHGRRKEYEARKRCNAGSLEVVAKRHGRLRSEHTGLEDL